MKALKRYIVNEKISDKVVLRIRKQDNSLRIHFKKTNTYIRNFYIFDVFFKAFSY